MPQGWTEARRRCSCGNCTGLKMHGGVGKNDLGKENVKAVKVGCANMGKHLKNLKQFGVPAVVAINSFITVTKAELKAVRTEAKNCGATAILCSH